MPECTLNPQVAALTREVFRHFDKIHRIVIDHRAQSSAFDRWAKCAAVTDNRCPFIIEYNLVPWKLMEAAAKDSCSVPLHGLHIRQKVICLQTSRRWLQKRAFLFDAYNEAFKTKRLSRWVKKTSTHPVLFLFFWHLLPRPLARLCPHKMKMAAAFAKRFFPSPTCKRRTLISGVIWWILYASKVMNPASIPPTSYELYPPSPLLW